MKHFSRFMTLAVLSVLFVTTTISAQAAIGKATAAFDNERPDRGETAWGRLVADAVRNTAHSDIALVNAGTLKRGTLKAGKIEATDIDALLSFGDDAVVTLNITGAQVRAALNRAAQAYPTGSTAYLHGSGFVAHFNPQGPNNQRVTQIQVQGRDLADTATVSVAMPVSLAQGADGYFRVWKDQGSQRSGATVRSAITDFIQARGDISPDNNPRFGPQ
ncbi:MAG: 5'-nucleotidase C-terminal domain-containing protein [Abitibacteriaceae bacterium]|nr:5'-nucleotidase C-terminal domain-containing protein [Abditibacteriaceae bacterium]MBV9868381.1 5'-nucleotidase C-terminal domain-containing protein [Abditibacteriaceae bacterium]